VVAVVDSTIRKEHVEAPYDASFVERRCSKVVEPAKVNEAVTGKQQEPLSAAQKTVQIMEKDWVLVGMENAVAKIEFEIKNDRTEIEAKRAVDVQKA
jgi:hypothetical protein